MLIIYRIINMQQQQQQVQNINPNVLVEAKKEWLKNLTNMLVPSILKEFLGQWEGCKIKCKENPQINVHELFVKTIQTIESCNDIKLEAHCQSVLKDNNCTEEDFTNRLSCVFIAFGKVLLSVKVAPGSSKLGLTIPKPKNFIHRVCIEAANEFMTIPELFDDRDIDSTITNMNLYKNRKVIEGIISASIETVISKSLPFSEISKDALQPTAMDASVPNPEYTDGAINFTQTVPRGRESRISVMDDDGNLLYSEDDTARIDDTYSSGMTDLPTEIQNDLSKYTDISYSEDSRRSSRHSTRSSMHNASNRVSGVPSASMRASDIVKSGSSRSQPKVSTKPSGGMSNYRTSSNRASRETIHANANDLIDKDDEIKTIPVVTNKRAFGGTGANKPINPTNKHSERIDKTKREPSIKEDVLAEREFNAKMRNSGRKSEPKGALRPSERIARSRHDAIFD